MTRLSVRPIPIKRAKQFVGVEHRHHPEIHAARWCLAAEGLTDGGEWNRPSRNRAPVANPKRKRRWELLHETARLLETDQAA